MDLNSKVHQTVLPHDRKRSWRRRLTIVGLVLGTLVLAVTSLLILLSSMIFDRYGKSRVERAFAASYPGLALRISELDGSLVANRLVAKAVTLSATNATLTAGRISLTGVRWWRLLRGPTSLAGELAQARLEGTNLLVEFPQWHYRIRCARLQASGPKSELVAEGAELLTMAGDEAFFAAHKFRTTRFHLLVPECRVQGLAFDKLLAGKSYQASAVHFIRPAFEALVNCEKPENPLASPPLMVPEALAAIRKPLRITSLSVTNGSLRYGERVAAGADPGVVTCTLVDMTVEGIANHGDGSAAVLLRAQGDLMGAAEFKGMMRIPIHTTGVSFSYAGSLTPMDLTTFNAFLVPSEQIRIKSGRAEAIAFEIIVTNGQARGRVRAFYQDLVVTVLGKEADTEQRLDHRAASLIANVMKIRNANVPDATGSMRNGKVHYTRKPEDEFLQLVWFALRSGLVDMISL